MLLLKNPALVTVAGFFMVLAGLIGSEPPPTILMGEHTHCGRGLAPDRAISHTATPSLIASPQATR
ncbi:hypothetical protein CYL20_09400 [Pseudomonas palleroniana]|uniref:Uncharacterized protein n=1 Tax=Pseudomonas palleroniana TaxID=191390 RepID=A0A2L1J8E5_9PSED|nr:hypothetical protein CYL20_09400 [Pseudomonas palleroniana]